MVTHYLTLQALSSELNACLQGATISEIFTQQKNELLIVLHNPSHECVTSASPSLCISVNPKFNYLFLRANISRAKKNSVDLFNNAIGLTINKILMHPYDRIVQIKMSDSWTLHFQLYNTAESNIVLVDGHDIICEAFKYDKELKGTTFHLGEKRFDERTLHSIDVFRESILSDASRTIYAALKQTVLIFGSTYSREILRRACVEEKTVVQNLSEKDIERIHDEIQNIIHEIRKPQPAIYHRGAEAMVLSVVLLKHSPGCRIETFAAVNEAVRSFVAKMYRSQGFEPEKKELLGKIESKIEHSRRSFEMINQEVLESKRAEEYNRIGKVLMANLQHLTKGIKEIELPDIFADGKPIQIKLDPKITPVHNAERYFEKAKKLKVAHIKAKTRLEEIHTTISLLEELLSHLDNCQTNEDLKEFTKTYKQELVSMKFISGKRDEERLPFRVFSVAGGFEVWVGKSSANNDLLTTKYTQPNDLWFHARGASGSHTVLKISSGQSMPSKESIYQTARIAAYYSKMRKAGSVPVAYCERKYVRKPKGSPEGTVLLEREKVIFVRPELP
jgi:predicted ribosome quality control (RQC) complex YloA/Tae2 family protein